MLDSFVTQCNKSNKAQAIFSHCLLRSISVATSPFVSQLLDVFVRRKIVVSKGSLSDVEGFFTNLVIQKSFFVDTSGQGQKCLIPLELKHHDRQVNLSVENSSSSVLLGSILAEPLYLGGDAVLPVSRKKIGVVLAPSRIEETASFSENCNFFQISQVVADEKADRGSVDEEGCRTQKLSWPNSPVIYCHDLLEAVAYGSSGILQVIQGRISNFRSHIVQAQTGVCWKCQTTHTDLLPNLITMPFFKYQC